MAQSYFPTRIASPVKEAFHESVFAGLHGDRQFRVDDVQEAYIESKDGCVLFSIGAAGPNSDGPH